MTVPLVAPVMETEAWVDPVVPSSVIAITSPVLDKPQQRQQSMPHCK